MPDDAVTEQEQIKDLNKRFFRMEMKYLVGAFVIFFSLLMFLIPRLPPFFKAIGMIGFILGWITATLVSYSSKLYTRKKFIKGLSAEEHNLIVSISDESLANYGNSIKYAKKILREIKPQDEYLRPSQPTESGDTLLRATTSADMTPQEQLLRSSQSDE